jgi:predicted phage terminase large subunit-like protein
VQQIELTGDMVAGFTGSVLASRFDNPAPIPTFHRELWDMCCLPERKVACAAPRGHAKSTAVTLSYALALALFRIRDHILIVSDTEGQASQFLGDIAIELSENEALHENFGKITFEKDNATELVAVMRDGYKFRIIAKGSEQKVRGLKWRNKRPNAILGDDLENDEIVMNRDRREKFKHWVLKALIPCGSDDCIIRIVGTILHMDSFLENILNDPTWVSRRYRAHNEDFSELLWPEKFSIERLQAIRDDYVKQGVPEGYSQEYLNYPIDEDNAYFRKEDFRAYDTDTLDEELLYFYSAIDFAITDKERSDFTVITTVGVDSQNNIYVVDVRRGRWDGLEIINEMFSVHKRYNPEIFTAEAGMIEKSLGAFIKEEMFRRGIFLNLNPMVPVKDKQTRARSIQARMRAGGVFFNYDATWFQDLQQEMLRFPRDVHDDMVDSLAWIGLTLDKQHEGLTPREKEDEDWEDLVSAFPTYEGQSAVTGY